MQYQTDKVVDKLYLAFSRDQVRKIYVQDVVRENGDEFYDLFIRKEGYVYICG